MDILTPFRYCEYRELDQDKEVVECVTLAGHVLAGMPMCEKHAKIVQEGLADHKLVRSADKGDSVGAAELKDYERSKESNEHISLTTPGQQ